MKEYHNNRSAERDTYKDYLKQQWVVFNMTSWPLHLAHLEFNILVSNAPNCIQSIRLLTVHSTIKITNTVLVPVGTKSSFNTSNILQDLRANFKIYSTEKYIKPLIMIYYKYYKTHPVVHQKVK